MSNHVSSDSRWARRFKVLAIVITLILLCPLAWLLVERARGASALSKRLRELSARGERLELKALIPQRADTGTDAAAEWPNLTNELKGVSGVVLVAPPPLRFTSPGYAVVAWRLTEWVNDRTTNRWTDIASSVESASNLLARLHVAAEKPRFDARVDYRKGFADLQFHSVVQVKSAAQYLSLATMYELSRTNADAASQHLVALIQLSQQKVEPLVIWQLVRQACAVTSFNATWQFLQHPGVTEQQLARIQAALVPADFEEDLAASLEMERAMTIDQFRKMKQSSTERDLALAERRNAAISFGALQAWEDKAETIRVPLWRFAWQDQDQLRALNLWQAIIDLEREARSNGWSSLKRPKAQVDNNWVQATLAGLSGESEVNAFDRFRFMFSTGPFGVSEGMIRRNQSVQTQKHMTQAAVALKRYQLRTGRLPEDLDELVPQYLAAVPQDRMNHKTLRYVRLTGDSYRLYSVGENGRDDEGNPAAPDNRKSYGQIWDGLDAVWPKPASAEEAKAAVKKRP